MRRRLDAELVRRGLARSREEAQRLIADRQVKVNGIYAAKAATQVADDASVAVLQTSRRYVSRGAYKLIGALDHFSAHGLVVSGRHALDAGASTGGFTQVLLERGASTVLAVDVGYGQLAWEIRNDPRVVVIERTNVRTLTRGGLPYPPQLIVGDLSFISLTLVLPALAAVAVSDADYVLMVKPQFEVGKGQLGEGGVVRDPLLRQAAIRRVAHAASQLGLGAAGVVASPLPGPSGNVEYFLYLRSGAPALADEAISRAIEEGPQ